MSVFESNKERALTRACETCGNNGLNPFTYCRDCAVFKDRQARFYINLDDKLEKAKIGFDTLESCNQEFVDELKQIKMELRELSSVTDGRELYISISDAEFIINKHLLKIQGLI